MLVTIYAQCMPWTLPLGHQQRPSKCSAFSPVSGYTCWHHHSTLFSQSLCDLYIM